MDSETTSAKYSSTFFRPLIFRLLSLICLLSSFSTLWAKVEIISYRGWKQCYQISNAVSKVIIVPESGGRVLAFTYKDKNIIYQDSTQNGKVYAHWKRRPFDPDGGRLDYGPWSEVSNAHAQTWMGKWEVKAVGDYSVSISFPNDSLLGLSSERTFILDKHSAKLTTHQTAANISNKTVERHFWSRTLVNPGGLIVLKLNPKSRFKQGWATFLFNPDRISQEHSDSRISINKNKLYFVSQGSTFKFGTDLKSGLITYQLNDLAFTKHYKIGDLSRYGGSDNMNTIFYHSPKFLEIEPTSETSTLKPGEQISFTEVWKLTDR